MTESKKQIDETAAHVSEELIELPSLTVNESTTPIKRIAENLYKLHTAASPPRATHPVLPIAPKLDHFRDRILPEVIWPNRIAVGLPNYGNIRRARDVHRSLPKNTFYSRKMLREVQFESTLEHRVFWLLEQSDEVLYYQEQPLAIPYVNDETEVRYYPDVMIWLRSGRCIVAEVKVLTEIGLHVNQLKFDALQKFCDSQGWGKLITDGRRTAKYLETYKQNPKFVEHVMSALEAGSLDWANYRAIRARYGCNNVDLNSLILSEKLIWTLRPFCLSLPD
ncbi:MAG: hypothetical protein K2W95_08835 [Candidatus Obscuribacterales bacterium]|nr:hypothetical protein [Candidatus Obscuribacterales bacterium]